MRPNGSWRQACSWVIGCAVAIAASWCSQALAETGVDKISKVRLVHVDSYHREYSGSELPFEGFCAALLELGYLDSREQISELLQHDTVESSTAVIRRFWMDSKRKDTKPEMGKAAMEITEQVKQFNPTLIFLSDDNATNYVGNQFLDTDIPVVFWGVKNNPLKYGLLDSIEHPGHNVTGVYAVGFYMECLQLLKRLVPTANTFAILSDDAETGRSHIKAMEEAARRPEAPLQLVDTVVANKFEEWKAKALELSQRVDALFLPSMNTLEDAEGRDISREEALRWYVTNIKIPETVHSKAYVQQGLLCSADFARYNQGFDAAKMAHDILAKGMKPAEYPPRSVRRGPLIVNKERARMLGITLTPEMGIEEYAEDASVLTEPHGQP